MEVAIVLMLTVALSVATPLRPTHRSDADLLLDAAQSSGMKRETQEQHSQALKIVPFHSDVKHLDLDVLKNRMGLKPRPRRASHRACQVGTCQVINLANTLYQISQRNGKDESKNTHDPRGFGR